MSCSMSCLLSPHSYGMLLLASHVHGGLGMSRTLHMHRCCSHRFGHVDLLDDVIDHWDAKTHLGERAAFVERLQAVAKARQARISFVSGDVHVAGIGRLYTRPKVLMPCSHLVDQTMLCTGLPSVGSSWQAQEETCRPWDAS